VLKNSLPSFKKYPLCGKNHQKSFQVDSMKIEVWPPLFAFTKEFLKNTKKNMPPDNFCSHLRQDGQIYLPSSPDCHMFIAVSKNTHDGHI
jgi:hypothetical protein